MSFAKLSSTKKLILGLLLFVIVVALLYPHLVSRYLAYSTAWELRNDPGVYIEPELITLAEPATADRTEVTMGQISFWGAGSVQLHQQSSSTETILLLGETGTTSVTLYKESGLALYDHLQKERMSRSEMRDFFTEVDEQSNYGYVSHMLSLTPDNINFFDSNIALISNSILLVFKSTTVRDYPQYQFENTYGVRGFVTELSGSHHIFFFGAEDQARELLIQGTSRDEAFAVASTLQFVQ